MNIYQNLNSSNSIQFICGAKEKKRGPIYETQGVVNRRTCAFYKDLYFLLLNNGLQQKNLTTDEDPSNESINYVDYTTEEEGVDNAHEESDGTDVEENSPFLTASTIYTPQRKIQVSEETQVPADQINNNIKIGFMNNFDPTDLNKEHPRISILTDPKNILNNEFTLEPKNKIMFFLRLNNKKLQNTYIGFTITNNGQRIVDTILKIVSHKFASTKVQKRESSEIINPYFILPEKRLLKEINADFKTMEVLPTRIEIHTPTIAKQPKTAKQPTIANQPPIAGQPIITNQPPIAQQPTITNQPPIARQPTISWHSTVSWQPPLARQPKKREGEFEFMVEPMVDEYLLTPDQYEIQEEIVHFQLHNGKILTTKRPKFIRRESTHFSPYPPRHVRNVGENETNLELPHRGPSLEEVAIPINYEDFNVSTSLIWNPNPHNPQ